MLLAVIVTVNEFDRSYRAWQRRIEGPGIKLPLVFAGGVALQGQRKVL